MESRFMCKLLIILMFVFSLPLKGQNDTLNRLNSRGEKTGYWISYDQNRAKIYEGFFKDGKPAGKLIRFHPNGKTRAELNYLTDGLQVEARLFDTDGRLRAEGTYQNQLKEGLWSFYSEKEKPVFRINYTGGKVHGEALRFDAEGELMEQTNWVNNTMNGLQTIFFPDRKPQAKITYRNGVMDGPYQLLFENGIPEVQGFYADGLKTGKWIYNLQNGNTDYQLNYKKGKLLNPDMLDARQRESFDRYEKNRKLLKDPQNFLNNPEELMIR
jgi:antitoxin component YwqK of YwqJK toxin-antitoxin module